MLSKCVNPICGERFRYLHEGRIFNVEIDRPAPGANPDPHHHIEHFWLCAHCARTLTVIFENGTATTKPLHFELPQSVEEKEFRPETSPSDDSPPVQAFTVLGKAAASSDHAQVKFDETGYALKASMVRPGEPMKRDFASLSAQEALHVAIFVEERNAEIYHQFAEMFAEFRDPESLEIAAAFWDMATEERTHGTLLQKRYFDRYGTRPCSITEEDISDFIEVPHLENGDIFTISRLKVGRSPRQMALEVALAAEQNAQRFYARLSEISEDEELRTLYREFVEFEAGHSDWLEKKVSETRRTSGGTKLA